MDDIPQDALEAARELMNEMKVKARYEEGNWLDANIWIESAARAFVAYAEKKVAEERARIDIGRLRTIL